MAKQNSQPKTQIHSLPSRGTRRTPPFPSPEQISRRAYELFLSRGGQHGRDLDDWLQAEAELRRANHRKAAQPKSR